MNEKNLKRGNPATQFKSGREAVEAGRKGGKKAAENRKRKKELRETLLDLLNAKYPDNKGNKYTGVEIIAMELFKAASDRKGRNYNRSLDQLLTLTGISLSDEDRKRIENALHLQEQEIELNQRKIDADNDWE